ncbi:MAG TPA: hypothetical protein ENJ00_02750 [Phycisphaerales bacterium]|nr:hypothetical protein [Phycisphaerales bacterium]
MGIAMTRLGSFRFQVLLGALLLALVPMGSALGQGEMIAARCIHEMRGIGHRTNHAVNSVAHRGIHLIAALDEQGASDDQLIAAANRIKERLHATARRGAAAVNEVAEACVRRLVDAGADDALIMRVNQARENVLGAIRENAAGATERVNMALHRALTN